LRQPAVLVGVAPDPKRRPRVDALFLRGLAIRRGSEQDGQRRRGGVRDEAGHETPDGSIDHRTPPMSGSACPGWRCCAVNPPSSTSFGARRGGGERLAASPCQGLHERKDGGCGVPFESAPL